MLEYLFLFRRVLKILEGDLLFLLDGVVDGIHIVVDALILRLWSAAHVNAAVQLFRLRCAGEMAQLLDEGGALFLRDKPGGFHRIHQQLQLRQFKQPLPHEVSILGAFDADDIHPGVLQQFDVGVNTLASGLNAVLLPECENVRDRDRMLLVCLPI